jgi:hypothetical protein
LFDLLVADRAWRTWPWLIDQSVQPVGHKTALATLITVDRATPSCRATWLLEVPSAQASTIRHRNANAWALLGRLAHRWSVDCSWAASTSGASGEPRQGTAVGVVAGSMAGTY